MSEALRKDPRWKPLIANARAVHGALGECLKISDQLSDTELKSETLHFVNAMEYLVASLLGQRRRLDTPRPPENELLNKLREEIAHIAHLLESNAEIAESLNDSEAKKNLFRSMSRLNLFAMRVEQKRVRAFERA